MRQVLLQDAVVLARCMLLVVKEQRKTFARAKILQAHTADSFRIQNGKYHPLLGNGTLVSCLSSLPRGVERPLDDLDFADCMVKALEAVIGFRQKENLSD